MLRVAKILRRTIELMKLRLIISILVFLFLSPFAAQATELENGREYDRNPLRITVTDESKAKLTDAKGVPIPFAADNDKNDGILHLPSLIAGLYKLEEGSKVTSFSVKSDVFVGLIASPAYIYNPFSQPSSSLPVNAIYGAIITATLLGIVLLRRKPVLIVAVTMLASALTFGVNSIDQTSEPPEVLACASITDQGTAQDCVLHRLHYLLAVGESERALDEFTQSKDMPMCHEVAHAFGRSVWVAKGGSGVLTPGYDFCEQGFYHGALEASAVFMEDEQFIKNVVSFCSLIHENVSEGVLTNCAHGIGHGSMLRFAGDIERGEKICSSLVEATERMKSECTGALYMEQARMIKAAEGDANYMPISSTPTKQLCKNLELDIAVLCYDAVSMVEPMKAGFSLKKLIEFCANEPSSPLGLRLACLDGIGREAHNHEGNNPGAGEYCKILNDPVEQQTCVTGISHTMLRLGKVKTAVEACKMSGAKNTSACKYPAENFWFEFNPLATDQFIDPLPPAESPFLEKNNYVHSQ